MESVVVPLAKPLNLLVTVKREIVLIRLAVDDGEGGQISVTQDQCIHRSFLDRHAQREEFLHLKLMDGLVCVTLTLPTQCESFQTLVKTIP